MIAPGLVSDDLLHDRGLLRHVERRRPWYWKATPLALASVPAPQLTVL